jgi:NAD(P)-dependent dehydrogenase (short-subunit alcohol dehydrogenase family)
LHVKTDHRQDLIKETARKHGEARIVMTSSDGYKMARKLDYDALVTKIPHDGEKLGHLSGSFQRYFNSKLAVVYFVVELDRRLREAGCDNVYINTCHPGNAIMTTMGEGEQHVIPAFLHPYIKHAINFFMGQTIPDCAKTQTWLAASSEVRTNNLHGGFWRPVWTRWWSNKFLACKEEKLTPLAADEQEREKLWAWTKAVVDKR